MRSASQKSGFLPFQRGRIEGPAELMREAIKALYDFTPIQSHENRGIFRVRNWYSAEAIFSWAEQDAVAIRRTKAQSEAAADLVYVHRYLDGHIQGRIGDLNIDRARGDIHVFDQEHRVECLQARTVSQGIYLRKSDIGYDRDRHPPLMTFPHTSSMGKLLNMKLGQLFGQLTRDDSVRAADLDQLKASLRMALGADTSQGDVRRHARDAIFGLICAFVESRLDDPSLGVQTLLNSFGVSRASLYRMFEPSGGVRQYVSNRRIMRAVLDLSNHPNKRGAITQAAYKWGFSSPPSFNRAVREKLGVSPGALGYETLQPAEKETLHGISSFAEGSQAAVEKLIGQIHRMRHQQTRQDSALTV